MAQECVALEPSLVQFCFKLTNMSGEEAEDLNLLTFTNKQTNKQKNFLKIIIKIRMLTCILDENKILLHFMVIHDF